MIRLTLLFIALGIVAPTLSRAQGPPAGETLCVLDFNRLGEDDSMDWLRRGLGDMMITAMNRLGPYEVVERERLQQLLREHDLITAGVVEIDAGMKQARLAKAELLLMGNFIKKGEQITIQVRVLRLSDQDILAMATWEGNPSDVLAAPRLLTQELLENLKHPFDESRWAGIETEIPQTLDAAEAFYHGVGEFEDGLYPEALAHYLDSASPAGVFLESYRAVVQMYDLLGRPEHAVAFAHRVARRFENEERLPYALEFYVLAAEKCGEPLDNPALAADFLERAVDLARDFDQKTDEFQKTKAQLTHETSRLDEKGETGVLRRHYRAYKTLRRELIWGLAEEPKLSEKAHYFSEKQGRWVNELYPYPSVFMWRVQTQRLLARSLARNGEAHKAIGHYRDLHDQLYFLTEVEPLQMPRLTDALETEAHFALLYHYDQTGEVIREHAFTDINPLNVVSPGVAVMRENPNADIDPRARTASRYEDRGFEFFDFASPEGYQIDAVVLTAKVSGLAQFSFYTPHPRGWPPQFSFSKLQKRFKLRRMGAKGKRVEFPPGTEFVSLGTAWGRGLYSNAGWEVILHKAFGPDDNRDIDSWKVEFELFPKVGVSASAPRPRETTAADKRLLAQLAKQEGWGESAVLRSARAFLYTGEPPVDVYTQERLAFPLNGDIVIRRRDDPRVTVRLPRTVNTNTREFDPSLVRTHEGGYALFWARGSDKRDAERFVARSHDLLEWQTPRRLVFETPADTIRYGYASAEPLERTTHIAPTSEGYVMLLGQGFVRFSRDLQNWGQPQKALPHDLLDNTLVRTRDGRLWAAYENIPEELRPFDPGNPFTGYFDQNGKQYMHLSEIHLAWSVDGVTWHPAGSAVFEGQASDLWLFPLATDRVAVALQFNNLFLRWLVATGGGELRRMSSTVNLMADGGSVLYAGDGRISCITPIFDHFEEQRHVLVRMSSREQYERLVR